MVVSVGRYPLIRWLGAPCFSTAATLRAVGRLAAEQHLAQSAEGPGRVLRHQVEQRRRQPKGRDATSPEFLRQVGRRKQYLLVDDGHTGPVQQRTPDFESGRVKTAVGGLRHHVGPIESDVVGVEYQPVDRAVRDGYSFRLPRGSGGVDHVGEAVAIGPPGQVLGAGGPGLRILYAKNAPCIGGELRSQRFRSAQEVA